MWSVHLPPLLSLQGFSTFHGQKGFYKKILKVYENPIIDHWPPGLVVWPIKPASIWVCEYFYLISCHSCLPHDLDSYPSIIIPTQRGELSSTFTMTQFNLKAVHMFHVSTQPSCTQSVTCPATEGAGRVGSFQKQNLLMNDNLFWICDN